MPSPAFLAPAPLAPARAFRARALCTSKPRPSATRRLPRRGIWQACDSQPDAPTVLQEGAIVAVRRGSAFDVDIARVTGASSSGTTVDIELLEPFVSELYVSGGRRTYAKAAEVRAVRAEYAASQSGWIVLDADVRDAETQFRAADAALGDDTVGDEKTVAVERQTRELSEQALTRQRFRPTKGQALFGAALSVPLATALFYAYRAAADTYAANPAGDDLMSGELFRAIVRVALATGAGASLLIGAGLLFSALSMKEDDAQS